MFYDCECEDVDAPVCGYDYLTGPTRLTPTRARPNGQAWIVSEGDCAAQPVYGCTDENAVNYNPDATDDDGSCVVVPECGDDQMLAVATLTTAMGWRSQLLLVQRRGRVVGRPRLHRLRHNGRLLLLGRHCGVPRVDHGGQLGDGWNDATLTVTVPSENLNLGTFTLAEGAAGHHVWGGLRDGRSPNRRMHRPLRLQLRPDSHCGRRLMLVRLRMRGL